MPVLAAIRERFERERPLEGIRISACLHVTTETANLARTLAAGGADVVLCASNPLSTQDDVAAALVDEYGISVYAIRGEDNDTYYSHIEAAVDHRPQLTMDDGADVIGVLHKERRDQLVRDHRRHRGDDDGRHPPARPRGAGRARLPDRRGQRGADEAPLRQPLRHRPVDHRRDHPRHQRPPRRPPLRRLPGTAGRAAVSPCAPAGMGAHVIVTEVDPVRALEALMDGYEVMPIERAAEVGDIFCTATGDKNVIARAAIERLKDGAILANTGHFNVEIEIPALEELAVAHPRGAPRGRGVRVRRRPPCLPDRRGPARQPRRGRRPPGRRHGHELRQPGPLGRVRRRQRRRARGPRLRRARGDRPRDRPPQAREHGRRDRHASPRSRPSTWRPGTRAPRRSSLSPTRSSASSRRRSSSSTSASFPTRSPTWTAARPPRWPRRSARSPCAARRPSASRPPTATRSRRRAGRTSTRPQPCSSPRGRPP